MTLKKELRESWTRLASFSGDIKSIFAKDIDELQDDNMKLLIFHVIEILHDSHYVYSKRKMPMEDSLWEISFNHVFSQKVFVTGFRKYTTQQKFPKSFIKFVNGKIKLNYVKS